MHRVTLIAATIFIQGCVSTYVYPDVGTSIPAEQEARGALSRLVLGVERNLPGFDYGWAGEPQAPFDVQTLIEALKEYHVFRQVGYVDQLKAKPDLTLMSYRHAKPDFRGLHGEAGGPLCNFFLMILTLTVMPANCSSEEEVSFIISNDTKQSALKFIRYEKEIWGVWAPVVAAVNANWRSVGTRVDSEKSRTATAILTKRYKKFLVARFRELEPRLIELVDRN
jgi:hypothetical protein